MNPLIHDIREDLFKFTRDKEVQQMILAEDLAIMDWNSNMNLAEKRGRAEERADIIDLFKWLRLNNRDDDVNKGIDNPGYLEALLKEYAKAHPAMDQ